MTESEIEPDDEWLGHKTDFRNIYDHHEGIGVHATNTTKSDNELDSLFYDGKKTPPIWWEEL